MQECALKLFHQITINEKIQGMISYFIYNIIKRTKKITFINLSEKLLVLFSKILFPLNAHSCTTIEVKIAHYKKGNVTFIETV